MTIQKDLVQIFKRYSTQNALYTYNTYYTYNQLYSAASNITNMILNISNEKQPVIIMGSKSFFTHAGIIGTVMAGSYYTPLNETFPIERNIDIIKISNAQSIVIDIDDFKNYENILDSIDDYNIICPEKDLEYITKRFPNHKVRCNGQSKQNIAAEENDAVYMLFTSGSTGIPKGIKISHYNLYNYIKAFTKRNSITDNDRFIQMNDLTFDLSVHSLFLSILHGACLYIPSSSERINPVKFINDYSITNILMVPSSIAFMKKMRVLKDNSLMSVKYLSFCGETLPFDNAILMAKAAPNAKLENLYGPTEATIACTYFEFDKNTEELIEYSGSMPIGNAYDGMNVELFDNNLNKIIDNSKLVFLGRNDTQVQIKGYRVEIFEIEHALSKINGIISNAVIPTPVGAVTYENTTAFITCNTNIDLIKIKEELSKKLPNYMVPNNIIILDNMPLNSNGKIDRNQLKKILKP